MSRAGSRPNDRVDLAVAAGIGAVNLLLKDQAVEHGIGVEAGQRPHDVVGTEVAVLGHENLGQTPLKNADFDDAISLKAVGAVPGDASADARS